MTAHFKGNSICFYNTLKTKFSFSVRNAPFSQSLSHMARGWLVGLEQKAFLSHRPFLADFYFKLDSSIGCFKKKRVINLRANWQASNHNLC